MIYSYYKFLEMFHVEPRGWNDLFEFYAYAETKNKIEDFLRTIAEAENANGD